MRQCSLMFRTVSLSPSRSCAVKSIYAALEILKEEGGELRSREIVNRIPELSHPLSYVLLLTVLLYSHTLNHQG